MTDPPWLDERETRAWRGYRRMRALLDLQIIRDLAADAALSDADYDVLSTLSETATHHMRLHELASAILWSNSRLSHHISRMAQRGLVRREEDEASPRACVIGLTADGLRTIREAAPGHVASVRRHFIDLLTTEQLDTLGDVAETVVAELGDDQPLTER
jgi:DNA-binding MarR family transcriptional regulator